VNLQVEKLAPTLMELSSDDVYHFGAVPAGSHGPTPGTLLSAMNSGEFVAGDFTHRDGTRFVLIVNKDFANSRPCLPQFRTPRQTVQMVSAYTGKLVEFGGEHKWLAPGQGVLLKLPEVDQR
jgi:hypothetical protein